MTAYNDNRRWMYSKTEGAKIFEKGAEIPAGWYDSPAFDDPRTRKMWEALDDGVVPGKADPVKPKSKKYPSQMNQDELIDFGKGIGLELNEAMTVKEMRLKINEFIEAKKDEA